jgi:hypothetical protein
MHAGSKKEKIRLPVVFIETCCDIVREDTAFMKKSSCSE